jgi:hypothetical protein
MQATRLKFTTAASTHEPASVVVHESYSGARQCIHCQGNEPISALSMNGPTTSRLTVCSGAVCRTSVALLMPCFLVRKLQATLWEAEDSTPKEAATVPNQEGETSDIVLRRKEHKRKRA